MILVSSGALFHMDADGRMFVPGESDVAPAVDAVPSLPVDGMEVLVTRRMVSRLREAAGTLNALGVPIPVVHGPKRLGAALPDGDAVDQLRETGRFARDVGADVVVLHLWDLPHADADMDGRVRAARLAADVLEEQGLTLAVETIPCIHATPLANIERVLAHDDRVRVVLDTEFLAFHDEVEAALAHEWLWSGGHVRHIHLKDFSGSLVDAAGARRYLLPGRGSIDFGALFERLEDVRFAGTVSLEASAHLPDGQPDVAVMAACLRRMAHSPWRFSPDRS